MPNQTLSTLRRRAARRGLTIWKPRGRPEWEYGPYALVDARTTGIVRRHLGLDELASEIEMD